MCCGWHTPPTAQKGFNSAFKGLKVNQNTVTSAVPILGRYNLFEINLKTFELIVQNLKIILSTKTLLVSLS